MLQLIDKYSSYELSYLGNHQYLLWYKHQRMYFDDHIFGWGFQYYIFLYLDIDECLPGVCGTHGTCIDQINSYRCACAPGFTGDSCGVSKWNSC